MAGDKKFLKQLSCVVVSTASVDGFAAPQLGFMEPQYRKQLVMIAVGMLAHLYARMFKVLKTVR